MDRLWIFLLVTSTLVAYGGTTWVTDLQKEAYCKCLSPLGNGINFQGLTLVGGIYDHRRKLGYTLKDLSEFPGELDTPWVIWELLNGLPGIPEITPWIRNKVGLDSGFMDGFPRRLQPRWNPMQEMNPEWLRDLEKVYCKCLSRQGNGINLQGMMFGGIYDQSRNRGWLLRDLSEYPGVLDIQWVILKLLSGLPSIPGNVHTVEYPGVLRPLWMLWQELSQLPGIPGTLLEELSGRPRVPDIFGGIQSGLPGVPGISGSFQSELSGRPGVPDISGGIQTSGLPGLPSISGGYQSELSGHPGVPDIFEGIQTSGLPGVPGISGGIQTEPNGFPGKEELSGWNGNGIIQSVLNAGGDFISKTVGGGEDNEIIPSIINAGGDVLSKTGDLIHGIGETAGELKTSITGGEGNGIIPDLIHASGDVLSKTGDLIHGIGETAGELKNSIRLPTLGGVGNGIMQTIFSDLIRDVGETEGELKNSRNIKGGTPGSTATWSFQVGGNQLASGLDLNGGIPGSTDIKAGTPGSTATWSFQFGGNQPGNGLDIKGGTPGSTVIKGGIPGTTDINGGTPGSPGTWSFQFGGNQPGNGLGLRRPSHGKYFVTAFMHNSFSNASPSKDFLFTGTAPSTTVTVSINNSNFKKYVTVAKGETVTVQLPPATENRGSGICPCGAIITSDQDITVMSRNFKETSGDVALIYPVDQWGTVYYIITPTNGPSSHSTEFGVLAREFSTTVTIIFSGTVQFNRKYYQAGDIMTINLQPFQFVQFQSKDDLSGTKVTSQLPVAILAGHSCVPSYADCSHVYEQLQPFESWGTSFFVPGLSFQSNNDLVYVLAFKTTCLEYQSGEKKQKTFIEAGKLMKFEVSAYSSLSMHSLERIQVLLFGTGGKFRSRGFGPFLTKIPDIESFNLAYNIIGQEDFENNLAIIIAKTSSASEITFNGEDLRRAKWTEFPQSEYSWLEYNYGMDSSSNTMQHSTTPFGLLSIGYTRNMAYGSVAPSTQGLVGQFPESKGMQVVKEKSKGQRKGLLQNLLNAGGDIISKTGELVEGIGETAGDLKSSIIGGENYGLIPSMLHAGGEVIKGTGDIIHGIGDTA